MSAAGTACVTLSQLRRDSGASDSLVSVVAFLYRTIGLCLTSVSCMWTSFGMVIEVTCGLLLAADSVLSATGVCEWAADYHSLIGTELS